MLKSKIFWGFVFACFIAANNEGAIAQSEEPSSVSQQLNPILTNALKSMFPQGYEIAHMKEIPSINQDKTYYLEIHPHEKTKIERLIVKKIGRGEYAKRRTVKRTAMAASVGIAPKVRWSSSDHDIIILDFIDGDLAHKISPEFIEKVANNFKKFHTSYQNVSDFPERYTISKRTWNRKEEVTSKKVPLPPGFDKVFEHLKEIDKVLIPYDQFMPIHGDATYTNILMIKENVIFIDWGDSVTSDPFDDLGMFVNDYALSPDEQELLLKAYTQGDVSKIDRARLYFKRLQALLHQSLWYLILAHQQHKKDPTFSWPFMSWIINMGDPMEMMGIKQEMHRQGIFPETPVDFVYLGLAGVRQFLYEVMTADFKKHKAILEKGKK